MLGRDKAGSGPSLEKQEGAQYMGLWSRHGIPRAPGGEAPDSPGVDEVSCVIQGGRGMPNRASDKKGSLNQKLFNSFFNMNRGRFLDHCLIGEHSSRGVGALLRGTGTHRKRLEL